MTRSHVLAFAAGAVAAHVAHRIANMPGAPITNLHVVDEGPRVVPPVERTTHPTALSPGDLATLAEAQRRWNESHPA